MDRRDDDMASNAWPGFVDILSSVIIMFVFFVLIIAIILSILSLERVRDKDMSSTETEERDQESDSRTSQQIMDLLKSGEVTIEDVSESILNKRKAEEMTAKVEELEKELQQIQIGLSNSESDDNEVIREENNMVIKFSRNAVSINEVTGTEIKEFIRQIDNKDAKIRLVSSDNQNASYVSTSRKVNLARSFNIRNSLIEAGWNAKNISIHYEAPEKIDDSYDWVRIEVQN